MVPRNSSRSFVRATPRPKHEYFFELFCVTLSQKYDVLFENEMFMVTYKRFSYAGTEWQKQSLKQVLLLLHAVNAPSTTTGTYSSRSLS